ncbi:hypothetical protein M8818_006985 [Zalaria obscura]|uniref:Uncharacterized protein n=1 Tax=Zalaria obscura TaxID=2024903 RepID=A0ACC3S4S4_9PEZI
MLAQLRALQIRTLQDFHAHSESYGVSTAISTSLERFFVGNRFSVHLWKSEQASSTNNFNTSKETALNSSYQARTLSLRRNKATTPLNITMTKHYDVTIAGAGPVGLLLACELALGKASVLVLENAPSPESPWKTMPLGGRGLNTVAVEALYRRGLLNKFTELDILPKRGRQDSSIETKEGLQSPEKKEGFQLGPFAGHFAGIMLDSDKLELGRWSYRLPGPGLHPGKTTLEHMERVLFERAENLGVTILRGHGVTKIAAQGEYGVTVEAGGGQHFRSKWLVGCDGGRSMVRKLAGFEFVGTEPKYTGYSVKCDLEGANKFKPGFNPTDNGMFIFLPPNCLHMLDFDAAAFDRSQEITKEHLQDVLNRVAGTTDVKIKTLESGRGLLVDFEDNVALKQMIVDSGYEARVDYVGIGAKDTCGLRAFLVRPDGIVAWVAEENRESTWGALYPALEQWFEI